MQANKAVKSDVMMLSNNLEKDLETLRIRIVDRPKYAQHEHQVDEDTLRDELEESVNYSRPQQVSRDVESISAVMRLRGRSRPVRIEECRALFVTTNSALVGVAQRHFSEGPEANGVPLCITDYSLTNLLWLKRPTAAPDLPRKRIIADCYAATRPSERLWKHFLQEIEKLRYRDEVTPDEYFMLRNSTAAESALMETTMGQEEGFTQGTVPEILERVRSNIVGKKQAEVDREKAAREATQSELEAEWEQGVRRRASIRSRAQKYASVIVGTLKILLLLVLALATVYSFGWGLSFLTVWWLRLLAKGALLVLLAFSMASFWNGTTVENVTRRLEVALTRWIEQKLLALTDAE